MTLRLRSSAVAIALGAAWITPAQAQDATIQDELSTMRAEMARMVQRIGQLEGQLAQTEVQAAAATETAGKAAAAVAAATADRPSSVSWKGAPKFKGKGGWSFKPRGRLQFDAGMTNAPASTGRSDGFGNEVRRARLGVQGDIPGGFGYKFELDFAGGDAEFSDAILSYSDGPLKIAIGQHNTFQGLEELSSSLNISMLERAAFTDAFGFERRLGLSAQYLAGDILLQGGVFSDNFSDLSNKSWSVDGRAVYMPKLGETQLHLGGSIHYSELNDASDTARYRQRPLVHFTSERFINTGSFTATDELGFGLEAAAISGPFHAAAEGYWQKTNRPAGLADPTFFGGYAEVGYFLTGEDSRGYKKGVFGRIKPANPVGDGGIGAIQVNLRYDHLDLNDAGIIGGSQKGYMASIIWTPVTYTRFMLNYARLNYSDAVHPAAGGDVSYGVNAFGMRAQIDF